MLHEGAPAEGYTRNGKSLGTLEKRRSLEGVHERPSAGVAPWPERRGKHAYQIRLATTT